jgi:hypothetical protein
MPSSHFPFKLTWFSPVFYILNVMLPSYYSRVINNMETQRRGTRPHLSFQWRRNIITKIITRVINIDSKNE